MTMIAGIISVVSIVVGIVVIRLGVGEAVMGSYLVLSVLGAPLTFLNFCLGKVIPNISKPYTIMFVLYFLQYQILAVYLWKAKNISPTNLWAVLGIILISMIIMYCWQTGVFV